MRRDDELANEGCELLDCRMALSRVTIVTSRGPALTMSVSAILTAILAPISALTQFLSTTPVHTVLYPFPWISTIHATRISLAYRGRLRVLGHADGKLGRGPELAGFLMMV